VAAYIVKSVDGAEPPDCTSDPFPDVSNDFWACKYIKRANDLGIVSGFPDGNYKPTQIVNRGQMAAFITKGMIADGQLPGAPATCEADPFSDVPSGHTFCKYIQELVSQGIASGFPDGTYKPTQQVNRAQMAVFVGRAFLGMQ
jgi:endo-1,4-beta-xylanase